MHDIWNPWHGCRKCSEGCQNCYMYYLDGKLYKIEENGLQSEQALKSGLSFRGKPIAFRLTDEWGWPILEEKLYKPYFGPKCENCGMKFTCNGCSRCGKCEGVRSV